MEDVFRKPLSKKHVFLSMTFCFFKRKHEKTHFFIVKKAKQKLLFENCKCFFKKEKIVLKAYCCWSVSQLSPLWLLAWFLISKF